MGDDPGHEDDAPFLSRWSRRKLEAKEAPPAQPAPVAVPVADTAEPAPMPELPPLASLDGLKSEYKDFLHPQVDEQLRRGALKKLFSDPHFNVMDMLDTYVDDYSIADPIPEAMLRQMIQSKTLALFDHEEKEEAGASDTAEPAGGDAQALLSEAPAQTNSPTPGPDATNSPEPAIPDAERKNI